MSEQRSTRWPRLQTSSSHCAHRRSYLASPSASRENNEVVEENIRAFLRIHLQAPQGTSEERTWGRPRGSWRSRKSSPATEKRPGAPRHPITMLRNIFVEKVPHSSRTFNRFSIRTYRIQTYSMACRIPHQILRMQNEMKFEFFSNQNTCGS